MKKRKAVKAKKAVSYKKDPMSPVIQFAVIFIMIAAIVMVAYVSKNYL
ncbi:MAG: hypothetical protein WC489_03855 [Patescibacteria group bacterium]